MSTPIGTRVKIISATCPDCIGRTGTVMYYHIPGVTRIILDSNVTKHCDHYEITTNCESNFEVVSDAQNSNKNR